MSVVPGRCCAGRHVLDRPCAPPDPVDSQESGTAGVWNGGNVSGCPEESGQVMAGKGENLPHDRLCPYLIQGFFASIFPTQIKL